jgi:peptidoglycan/xylan/chitin deacetylase (PgdA/CDA1 family)
MRHSLADATRRVHAAATVRVNVLMYHDVITRGQADASGFRGAGPARYKLDWARFAEHLDALAQATTSAPTSALDLIAGRAAHGAWSITFDDGGANSLRIAEELSRHNWCGGFFFAPEFIGTSGFLGPDEVRALHRQGHLVGSHSYSHPSRMSSYPWSTLVDEWRRSATFLADLLGEQVSVASVPGGYYSREVARAAAAAGMAALYTSEPVRTVQTVGGCLVIGRHAVRATTSAREVAAIATGRPLPWARQRAAWTFRKAAKAVGGDTYLKLRSRVLERQARRQR